MPNDPMIYTTYVVGWGTNRVYSYEIYIRALLGDVFRHRNCQFFKETHSLEKELATLIKERFLRTTCVSV